MSSERLKMIDLFSGAGGLSEGLSEAGFHSLFASEIVPVYAQTYQKNHPNTTVFTARGAKVSTNRRYSLNKWFRSSSVVRMGALIENP